MVHWSLASVALCVLFCCSALQAAPAAQGSCDPGWTQYKSQKCYRVVDDTFRTFPEAEKACTQLNAYATLPITHTKEEHDFLVNYLFTTTHHVDNFWLGIKLTLQNNNKEFHWIDGAKLTFTAWEKDSPKSVNSGSSSSNNDSSTTTTVSAECAQIDADPKRRGQWVDEPCNKRNLVVCQRTLAPKVNLTLEQVGQAQVDLANEVAKLKAELASLSGQSSSSSVPIGFVYVQLPSEKEPSKIWPAALKWADVSATYAGVFFRVLGGDAAGFGEVQQDQTRQLVQGQTGFNPNHPMVGWHKDADIPKTGWSGAFLTGTRGSSSSDIYLSLKTSEGEVRPKNMAVRVWKRTA